MKIVVKDCTAIGTGCFKNNNLISRVVINDGVVSIGSEAFAGCKNLKQVFIPDSIKLIEPSAFIGSGVLLKLPTKTAYTLKRTLMIFCKENSYADTWFKAKKTGYIVVNSLNTEDKHGTEN